MQVRAIIVLFPYVLRTIFFSLSFSLRQKSRAVKCTVNSSKCVLCKVSERESHLKFTKALVFCLLTSIHRLKSVHPVNRQLVVTIDIQNPNIVCACVCVSVIRYSNNNNHNNSKLMLMFYLFYTSIVDDRIELNKEKKVKKA